MTRFTITLLAPDLYPISPQSIVQFRYYCELDLSRAYDGPVKGGVRPLKHLKRFNYFEVKAPGGTLSEALFTYYSARSLMCACMPKKGRSRRKQSCLTIVTAHKPVSILNLDEYNFLEIEPWKYVSRWIAGFDIYILILPELRKVDGGEPMAYLQALEGNPMYQKTVWRRLLELELTGKKTVKDVIIKPKLSD